MSFAAGVRRIIEIENPGLVWLVSLTHAVNEFFSLLIPPLFPFLVPGLGIGYTDASLLVVVFFGSYAVCQVPAGRLGDAYGARPLLAGGIAVMAAGFATVAVAPSFSLMLVGMLIAGVGGSTYHPTGMAVISDVETETTYGRSMGIHGTLGTLGTVSAPIVMTAVTVAFDWQTALLVASAFGAFFATVLFVAYPRVTDIEGTTDGETSIRTLRIDPDAIRDATRRAWRFVTAPGVGWLIGLFVVVGAQTRAVQTFIPLFASDAVGTDPAFGNAMLVVTMVSASIASIVAGYGADAVDRRWFAIGVFSLVALVVVGLVVLPLGRLLLPVGFAVLGFVIFSLPPAKNAIAASMATRGRSGSLFGITNTTSAAGASVGPFLLGAIADFASLRIAFLATIVIPLVGIVIVARADFS